LRRKDDNSIIGGADNTVADGLDDLLAELMTENLEV
jgi:hypothetical protein